MKSEDIAKLSRKEKHIITENIIIRYPFFEHIKAQLQHCQTFSKISAEPECILITGVKHPNRNRLDRHLVKLDFVFQPDIVENGFDLLFEFGKRTVIAWSEPLVFGFSPECFR